MSFDWLDDLQRQSEKADDYAEKTLAAYRLGIKAGGSIVAVRVQVAEDSCRAAKDLAPSKTYHPDEAPRLPLQDCSQRSRCHCVYRPVMTYQLGNQGAEEPPG